jgi:hypothetical protein
VESHPVDGIHSGIGSGPGMGRSELPKQISHNVLFR